MDWATLLGDGAMAAATMTGAVVSTVAARRAGAARDHSDAARQIGAANAEKLDQVQRQTDGRMDERIAEAVRKVAKEHPGLITEGVATDAIRMLLDAFLATASDTEEQDRHWQYGPPRRREEDHK